MDFSIESEPRHAEKSSRCLIVLKIFSTNAAQRKEKSRKKIHFAIMLD